MTVPLISVVADYGFGDLAFAEVTQRLKIGMPGAQVAPVPVPAFDTLSAGFCVAQLALNPGPKGHVVFHNVAPRDDADHPRDDNEGERLVAATTPRGVLVIGPFAGFVLSYLLGEIDDVREVNCPAAGSQFRSRDIFPEAIAEVTSGQWLGKRIGLDEVPAPPDDCVVYVDGYGNLKTSWHDAPADSGTGVTVRVGDAEAEAVVSDGTFEVPPGVMSFAPGSSGWPLRAGGSRVFYELLLRGSSAAEALGHPAPGDRLEVTPR